LNGGVLLDSSEYDELDRVIEKKIDKKAEGIEDRKTRRHIKVMSKLEGKDKITQLVPGSYIPTRHVKKFLGLLMTVENNVWIWIVRLFVLGNFGLNLVILVKGGFLG